MRRQPALFAAVMLITQHLTCAAGGMPAIYGTTTDGHKVAIDFDDSPRVEVWIDSKDEALQARSWRRYENEPCVFSESEDRKGRYIRSFSCPPNAKSPFAGAKYLAHPVIGGCGRGGPPDYIYMCIEGCVNKKRIPKKMEQGAWEC
jgi:hypothetical protein